MWKTKLAVGKIKRNFQVTTPTKSPDLTKSPELLDILDKDLRPIEEKQKDLTEQLVNAFSGQPENEYSHLSEDEVMALANDEIRKSRKERTSR